MLVSLCMLEGSSLIGLPLRSMDLRTVSLAKLSGSSVRRLSVSLSVCKLLSASSWFDPDADAAARRQSRRRRVAGGVIDPPPPANPEAAPGGSGGGRRGDDDGGDWRRRR